MNDKSDREASATTTATGSGGPWAEVRREFPILEEKVYLNSNSLGALSRRSLAERRRFEGLWNELGAAAWYDHWLAKLAEVRSAFGRTVNAGAGEIALMPSVSAALATVAGALRWDRRPVVVCTELDFPTLVHQFLSRRSLGVELRVVESPDGIEVPLERIAAAVDERTALLATSHVFYTSGAIQDARALARIAHDPGALLLLDAYQSNGQLPVEAEAWGVDFLVSGALKWLLGGPGLAFLRVAPHIRLQPTTLSWFGVEDQFSFPIRDPVPRSDARRFELGTPAVGAAYTASGGVEIVEEVGIPAIRRRNAALADDLSARLRERGFRLHVASEPDRRSALVLVHHEDPAGAVRWLADRDVIVDWRDRFVRFSPHFYNTVEDNVRAVEALAAYPG